MTFNIMALVLLFLVSFMPCVSNMPFMLSVIMLNVVLLSVLAPQNKLERLSLKLLSTMCSRLGKLWPC